MIIRNAVETDISRVISLQELWKKEGTVYGYIPNTHEELLTLIGKYFYVALVDEDIIGYIFGVEKISKALAVIPEGERYIELEDVYVEKKHRNKTVGTRLLDRLITDAKKDGIESLSLYSASKEVEKILRFYKRHEFSSWGIQMFRGL